MPTFTTTGASTPKRTKATANGIYTVGKSQFRIRKGDLLPLNYDEVFYRDPDPRGDAISARTAARLNATNDEVVGDADEGDEEATDEGGETADLPKRGRRKAT